MSAICGVADLLRSGGPVRVPLRECCAATLFGVDAPTRCVALSLEPAGPPLETVRPPFEKAGQGDRMRARP